MIHVVYATKYCGKTFRTPKSSGQNSNLEKCTLDFEKVPEILYSIVQNRSRNSLREKNSSIRVTVLMPARYRRINTDKQLPVASTALA